MSRSAGQQAQLSETRVRSLPRRQGRQYSISHTIHTPGKEGRRETKCPGEKSPRDVRSLTLACACIGIYVYIYTKREKK